MAFKQVFHELLQSREVALTLPCVIVGTFWKNSQAFSPCRRQLIELFHHDGWDELVRKTRDKERGHAALQHLPIGQELIPVAPYGQEAHGQEGEECGCHVRNAQKGVFHNNCCYTMRVAGSQTHSNSSPK